MNLKKTTIQYVITTEKSFKLREGNVYTIKVDNFATKSDIFAAVKKMFGVEPLKINTIKTKPVQRMFRGRRGTLSGFKKAIVKFPKDFEMKMENQ
jgi:large subunit ribosomal protein L23